jgi:hypothetical protein
MIKLILIAFCIGPVCCIAKQAPGPRHITLTYKTYLTAIPKGSKQLDWWVPVPASNDRQEIEIVSIDTLLGRLTTDPKYHNRIYYRHINLNGIKPNDTLSITLSFKIILQEKSVREAKILKPLPKVFPSADMQIYLANNRLIPLEGPIGTLSHQLALPYYPIPAARKVYDYLIDNMVYNYKAPGAGHGDAVWACSSKTGDCSDYNSVFIGICRSSGIPADHVFGLPLRDKQGKGKVNDWHCWARFWVEGPGWITIDASEASKHPELREYNFGTLSNQYLALSHGRDVVLEPAQKEAALNMFASPYMEIDGKHFDEVKWEAVYQESGNN